MRDWLAKNLIHKSEIQILECKSLQIVESTSNRSICGGREEDIGGGTGEPESKITSAARCRN